MMILGGLLLFIATFSLFQACEDIVREAPSGTLYGARIALVGNGYFLSANINTRNDQSTWAITIEPDLLPEDLVWNIEQFDRSGKSCFRIIKTADWTGRNNGRVLTAHSDRPDSRSDDTQVLVHSPGHSVDDECWNFEKVATNTYKIYKILGKNQGMNLVADAGTHWNSHWVYVSNSAEHATWRVYGNLELSSHVDLRDVRLTVRKPAFHGHGYALTAHSDRRNDDSTWVLAHKPGHAPADEVWNITPFTRQGVQCYRIKKVGGRNSGGVLTAHGDARGSDTRVLVHAPTRVEEDECWNFVINPETLNYRIFKALGRNAGMDLVADVSRNDVSYWVDVSNSRSMEWRITNSQGEYFTELCKTE